MGERVDSHGLLLPWDHCGTSSAAVLRGDDPMLAPQRRSGQHPGRTEGPTPGCQRWWPRATRRTMAVESRCDTLREDGTC